jgi:hypothetical protein
MPRRYPNPRLVKIHRSYSVAELAETLGKHRNTIRNWHKKDNLVGFYDGRQLFFHGTEARRFLEDMRVRGKQPCPPGMLLCFACKEARKPAFDEVELDYKTNGRRELTALCSACLGVMKQSVSAERLGKFRKILKVTTPPASTVLQENTEPIEDCD